MARKTKLTPQVQEAICQLIRAGNYIYRACQAAGITERTYMNWLQWGEERQRGIYFQFFQAVKKAEADAIARTVATIQKASLDSWQAAAWWLERKYPNEWGRRERIEHTGKDGGPIAVEHDAKERLLSLLNGMAERSKE